MELASLKRIRMEIDLKGRDFCRAPLSMPYRLLTWDDSLLDAFARAKYLSFRRELDVDIFPCLGHFEGCRRLMAAIAQKPGFLPEATWLAICPPNFSTPGAKLVYCGTVQGVRDACGVGAIQNLGVAPEHRRRGLGIHLLVRSLEGFRQAGVRRVYLEVTSHNVGAIRLYRRLGFTPTRIVYRSTKSTEKEEIAFARCYKP